MGEGRVIEWIKCRERMPNPYDWVLVCDSPKGTGEPRNVALWRWTGDEWEGVNNEFFCATFSDMMGSMFYDDATHWMPLPEAPKEE